MKFYFEPLDNLIIVDNEPHETEPFCIEKNDGNVIVNAAKRNDFNGEYQPFFGVISVKKDVRVFGQIRLTDWGNGNYDVHCPLSKFTFYTPPTAVAQSIAEFSGQTFTATVYRDSADRLLLEYDGATKNVTLPQIASPEIFLRPSAQGILTVVSAKCAAGEYLLIYLYDGKFGKLFEAEAEKTSFTPTAFAVTEKFQDMLLRRKTTDYTFVGTAPKITAQSFSYGRDDVFPNELIPYLLLEAVKADDFDCAESYLCDDLKADVRSLTDFFGDFDKIECPKYRNYTKKSDLNEVALLKFNQSIVKPKYYKFTIENGLITNIGN